MSSSFVILGLVRVREMHIRQIVKLTEFPDEDVQTYLIEPQQYNRNRHDGGQSRPFITKLQKKPEYLIVLRKEATQDSLNQIKIEDYIAQNLSNDCSEKEWQNKATQILLTWNLAEVNLQVDNLIDEASISYSNYALIYLILAIISFIVINILKHFI